eukprot:COSAG06_NODE_1478_length_9328_cov_2.942681_5_plen_369_part_00
MHVRALACTHAADLCVAARRYYRVVLWRWHDSQMREFPEPEPEPELCLGLTARRRGRSARRHARKHGHAAGPAVDFEALKAARRRRLAPGALVELLSAALEACRSDPCGRREHCLYILSLLRAESRLLEKAGSRGGPEGPSAVQLAESGAVRLALRAMEEHGCISLGAGAGGRSYDLRLAAAGAATLAHLAAAGGQTKRAVLEAGGVRVLILCLTHLADTDEPAPAPPAATLGGGSRPVIEQCVQCCRLLGNLTYGWGETVSAVKAELSAASGAVALVQLLARRGCGGAPLGQVLRWAAHALRNLAVGSPLMQTECGDAGAIGALCKGLAAHGRKEVYFPSTHAHNCMPELFVFFRSPDIYRSILLVM